MRPRVGDPSGDFPADWNFVPDTNEIVAIAGGNSFCSSHYDPDRLDGGGIGEVRQLHYTLSRSFIPAALRGVHHCGTDDQWRDGYPVGTPGAVEVNGVPVCCAVPLVKLTVEACICTEASAEAPEQVEACTCSTASLTVYGEPPLYVLACICSTASATYQAGVAYSVEACICSTASATTATRADYSVEACICSTASATVAAGGPPEAGAACAFCSGGTPLRWHLHLDGFSDHWAYLNGHDVVCVQLGDPPCSWEYVLGAATITISVTGMNHIHLQIHEMFDSIDYGFTQLDVPIDCLQQYGVFFIDQTLGSGPSAITLTPGP